MVVPKGSIFNRIAEEASSSRQMVDPKKESMGVSSGLSGAMVEDQKDPA